MVIEGKLHTKFDTQNVSDKFQKRDFVVEYSDNPMYPQYVSFQLTQDRCATLDQFQVGDKIEVTFNLRGREWISPQGEKKYFNTLEAWRIQKIESAVAVPVGGQGGSYAVSDLANDETDDLPF
jgi:hypothetical protein